MKKWNYIATYGLILPLVFAIANPVAAAAANQPGTDQASSKAIEAAETVNDLTPTQKIEITEEAGEDGVIQTRGGEILARMDRDTSSEGNHSENALTGAGSLPSSYDPRNSGRMTDILNQGTTNLCWAISGMDNAQIGLLTAGTIGQKTALFSAGHAAYAAYHGDGDTYIGIGGYANDSTAWAYQGGNYTILGSTLARWYGAAAESVYKTPGESSQVNRFSIRTADYTNDIWHLDSFELLPGPNTDEGRERDVAIREIKQAVLDDGSVTIDYYEEPDEPVFSNSLQSFYNAEPDTVNHESLIVGWDDSKETQAPTRGAFLIKNTWGTSGNGSGYYWLSYQDASMTNPVVYHMEESGKPKYNGNYCYDGVGQHTSISFAENIAFANVFTAARDETICAAGIYVPAGGSYTVSVRTGITDGTPNTGSVQTSSATSGTKAHYGYYTIPLNRGIPVKRGEKFAISVSIGTTNSMHAISFESDGRNSSSKYYKTTADAGESFLSADGGKSWADVQKTDYHDYGNVCIKALTTGTETSSTQQQNENGKSNTNNTHSGTVTRKTAMYRLYNPNSGEHFYTSNAGERQHLTQLGWRYEGIGWYAPASGDPVYRLYNPNAGDHHYTRSAGERDFLVRVGWRYEGVGWRSGGGIPVYRQYNPNARSGAHNYTKNTGEKDSLIRIGWRDEGIGWYAES